MTGPGGRHDLPAGAQPRADPAPPATVFTHAGDFQLADTALAGSPTRSHVPVRARFDTLELARVLSHYEIGTIESIKEFPRGSSRSPKVIVKCDRGLFLLKRRGPGRDDPRKVAFGHSVHLRLAACRFPVPRLIGVRGDRQGVAATMLSLDGHIYELFEYVHSSGYDFSPPATEAAGRALALFHRTVADHRPQWTPPAGGYHNAVRILPHLGAIPDRVAGVASGPDLRPATAYLAEAYAAAAAQVEGVGITSWPLQIIHGDWHPGNLLFRGPRVVAVLDFDAARMEPRALDLANGVLQFSISMKGENPDDWPDSLDEHRFLAFCRGYDGVSGCRIATAELEALVGLMIEALVVEAVIPIAATGSFARLEGGSFIRMVERKVRWLQENASRLVRLIGS